MPSILLDVGKTNNITIEQLEVMPEHIHLLVSFKPKYAPTNMVKTLKGVSARAWFKLHPETQQQLWGGHLWSPSYFMSTLGDMSKETVKTYIESQRTEKANSGRPKKV